MRASCRRANARPLCRRDAKCLALAAIVDLDPIMFFEHKLLYKLKGEVPVGHYTVPIGKAQLQRPGRDLTIIPTSITVHRSLDAARLLAKDGVEAEVIDLRSLRPLDTQTLVDSVKRTHRLLCVCEGARTLGIGAKISATIAESEALDHLDAPIIRLGGAECPIPYTPELERASVPQTEAILAAARRLAAARI
jgi:acetoin:2,6-dichlorophenolindophenol oxidoreductase subunit beta